MCCRINIFFLKNVHKKCGLSSTIYHSHKILCKYYTFLCFFMRNQIHYLLCGTWNAGAFSHPRQLYQHRLQWTIFVDVAAASHIAPTNAVVILQIQTPPENVEILTATKLTSFSFYHHRFNGWVRLSSLHVSLRGGIKKPRRLNLLLLEVTRGWTYMKVGLVTSCRMREG